MQPTCDVTADLLSDATTVGQVLVRSNPQVDPIGDANQLGEESLAAIRPQVPSVHDVIGESRGLSARRIIPVHAVPSEQLRKCGDFSRFDKMRVKARSETRLAETCVCESGQRYQVQPSAGKSFSQPTTELDPTYTG